MRGARNGLLRLTVVAALLIAGLASRPATAEVQPAENWWRNCANYNLTDRCIESVEYFDDASGRWIKATAEKNPLYHPSEITDEDRQNYASGENERSEKCGYGRQLNLDTCYRVPGAAIDGGEQILQTVVYGERDDLKLSFEATNGPVIFTRVRWGDPMYGVRENSLWRMTVISDLFGQDAGVAYAQMKEPTMDVFKGSDGHWRLQVSGRVQSLYSLEAWEQGMPTCEEALKSKNEFKANELRRPFSINVARYKYEYEKLKGSPPAGVFITNNGGCFSRLSFDNREGIIYVAVGSPHFDTEGRVIEGWVEASIRGDVVRKAFNLDPKSMNKASIEVTYSDGTSQSATSTTKYVAATDKVEIRAYGFHYSQPTVKMRLKPLTKSTGSSKNSGGAKPTYTCVKGKIVKTFVGKCPTGYKRK